MKEISKMNVFVYYESDHKEELECNFLWGWRVEVSKLIEPFNF